MIEFSSRRSTSYQAIPEDYNDTPSRSISKKHNRDNSKFNKEDPDEVTVFYIGVEMLKF